MSLIEDAAEGARKRVGPERIELTARAEGAATASSPAELGAHTDALAALFQLGVSISGEVHVVVFGAPDTIPTLHMRGTDMPSMTVGVPKDKIDAFWKVDKLIRGIGARVLLDQGGFFVLYGTFAEGDP